MSALIAPWLALALLAGIVACTLVAATARSLVVLCVSLWAAAALAAAALLTLGREDAALAIALFAAGLAPVLLFATLLLSARAAKANRRRPPWLAMIGALALLAALVWGLPDLPATPAADVADPAALFFAAPLLLAAVAAAVGLLGFGERGALEKFAEPADE